MATNFAHLLKRPALQAKKPEALPAGTYPAIITKYEFGDNNKNKTPYVRFMVKLTGWANDVPADEQDSSIDLSKRTMRRDFYLTDDSLHRLDDFIRSCGIVGEGKDYEEVLPELMGKDVEVEVQQYMSEKTGDIGNQIGAIKGA